MGTWEAWLARAAARRWWLSSLSYLQPRLRSRDMSGAAKRTDHGGRRGARSEAAAVEERAGRRGVVRAVAVRYGRVVCRAGFCGLVGGLGPLLADRQGWVTWSASTYLHLLRARAFACR
jgi:hypothetical protein